MNKRVVTFQVSPVLLAKVKERAQQEDRSVSSLIRWLLASYVQKRERAA